MIKGTASTIGILFVLVSVLIVTLPAVHADCCYGTPELGGGLGCEEVSGAADCPNDATYTQQSCDAVPQCQTLACCCHEQYGALFDSPSYTALCAGNYTPYAAQEGDQCQVLCTPGIEPPTRHNVTVTVLDQQGESVPGARVSPGNGMTDDNGVRVVTVDHDQEQVFSAAKADCQLRRTLTLTVIEETEITLVLDCFGTTDKPYRCTSWSDCGEHLPNKKTRECVACPTTNRCTDTTYPFHSPSLIESIDCVVPTNPDYCQDAQLDDGEECYIDPATGDVAYASGFSNETCGGCIAYSCTCALPSRCGDGHCTPGETCENCPDDCGNAPACTTECEISIPEQVQVSAVTGEPFLDVSWEFNGGNCVRHFTIEQCTTDGFCENHTLAGTQAGITSYTFTTSELDNQTEYCFTVYAFMDHTVTVSDSACKTTGTVYCMRTTERHLPRVFCDTDSSGVSNRHRCDQDNKETVDCDADGEVCFVNDDGNAFCGEQPACNLCNGVYGAFGGFDFTVLPPQFVPAAFPCSDLEKLGYCSFDKTTKNVNAYTSCGEVDGCYDYHSETACLQDTCNKVNQTCDWNWLGESEESGLGVCRPQATEAQRCSACEEDNTLFTTCTELTCPLYGEHCYATKGSYRLSQFSGCIGSDGQEETEPYAMGCAFYANREDCINAYGENQPASIAPNHELTQSDDLFDYGTCDWSATKHCIKDYDDNDIADCEHATGDAFLRCYPDNAPPTTQVQLGPAATLGRGLQHLAFFATDNEFYAEEWLGGDRGIDLLFSLDDSAFMNPAHFKNYLSNPDNVSSGSHTLRYYAQDYAHNLEVIHEETVTLLDDLDITIDASTYQGTLDPARGLFVNNLTIAFSTNREPVRCTANLSQATVPGSSNTIITGDGTQYELTYRGLTSGVWQFVVNCEDPYASGNASATFVLENNPLIQNVQPQGRLFGTGPVVITLDTTEPATCRLSSGVTTYDQMNLTMNTTNGTHHTYTDTLQENGAFLYYTACTSANNLVQGLEEDLVFFARDTQAPRTTLYDSYTEGPYQERSTEELALFFQCTDESEAATNPYFENTTFGCAKVRYQFGSGSWQEQSYPSESYPVFMTDYTQFHGRTTLRYYSVDHGGNAELPQEVTIDIAKVRDLYVDIRFADIFP